MTFVKEKLAKPVKPFIVTPELGDIIKVYAEKPYYGIVVGHCDKKIRLENYRYIKAVIIRKIKKPDFWDIDFFFPECRILQI